MEECTRKEQQILARQAEVIAGFPTLWSRMIRDWSQAGSDDRAWLMYSANYLFRTDNIRWAIDPLRLKQRLPQTPEVDFAHDLSQLSFVLLTHMHSDHLDSELIRELKHLPILWMIPEAMLAEVVAKTDLPADRIIIPTPGQCIDIHRIHITPFTALHWEKLSEAQSLRGVPAIGYLIEFRNKRWLFPGDTRTYDASQLPSFGPVDGLLAHLWLGRGCALQEKPPLLEAFCCFCLDLEPRQIILTHLQEFGRDVNDYWDEGHAAQVSRRIQRLSRVPVSPALIGDSVVL